MKKNLIKIFFFLTVLLAIVTPISRAYAAITPFVCDKGLFATIDKIKHVGDEGAPVVDGPYAIFQMVGCVLKQATDQFIWAGAIVGVIMIMISGLRYMASAGNPTAQQNAMKGLNTSVIGLAMLACFWSIFYFLLNILQVTNLQ